ncbi:type II secretion system protein GspM [Falsiroseomonas sp. CW058]|uniref:type II secretion system protein GspM n=1 Tax=Falsiroseomonas sp. CW058 TaxID=3388664 RepID=UPI003D31B54A
MTPPVPGPLAALSPAARRALAVGLLLPLPLAAWLAAAPLLAARQDAEARIAAAAALEERAAAIAARAPALAAERAALSAALARAVGPGGESGHALAGAALQRRLREAATRHGATVRSLETLAEEDAATVALRAQFRLPPPGLTALLAEIEGGGWGFAQVTSLTAGVAGGPVPPGTARPLEVQLVLRALRGGGR